MKRLGFLTVLIATTVVIGLASSSAMAGCIPAKTATNAAYPFYSYIDFANASGDNSTFIGAFWQTNNASGINNRSYGVNEWLYGIAGYTYYWYFYINLGDARADCASGSLTVYLEDTSTDQFILWTADEGAGSSGNFDFEFSRADFEGNTDGTQDGFYFAAPSLSPMIDNAAKDGSGQVTVDLTVADPARGFYSQSGANTVTEVRIYSQLSATKPDPTNVGAWTQVGALGSSGGAGSVTVDCSGGANEQWLAAGVVVDGQAPIILSEAGTPVECDPNLADPQDIKILRRDRDQTVAPRRR